MHQRIAGGGDPLAAGKQIDMSRPLMTGLVGWSAPFTPVLAEGIVFHGVLDNSPLDVSPRAEEIDTVATKEFRHSGKNPYRGQSQPVAEGKALYQARCQGCHLPGGRGRVGPSLVTNEPLYPRVATDVGLFEIIYGGASGSMQPFSIQGLSQDRILKIMAYIRSLK